MIFIWCFLIFFLSCLSSIFLFPFFIKKIGHYCHQPIRLDGPQEHLQKKQKRPTMGGIVLMTLVTFYSLLFSLIWPKEFLNTPLLCSLGIFLFFGLIGLRDDWLKISKKNSGGLSAKKKILAQGFGSLLAAFFLFFLLGHMVPNVKPLQNWFSLGSEPFFSIFYNFFQWFQNNGFLLAFFGLFFCFLVGYFYVFLVLTGTCNGVNLTDGLDGLVSVPLMVSYGFVGYVAWQQSLWSITLLSLSVMGSLLGFLWHNGYPGRLMMGDVGSLSLGGLLGFLFLLTGTELLLPFVGGIFLMESLSVILQVFVFRRKGKRLFLMAPLHHHFEKKFFHENHIVLRFWIVSLLLGLLGFFLFNLRFFCF